jgi:hypothetical protein
LWAEAKTATTDILVMLTQLVLTVGKAKTFDKVTPPHFLGCFDREKIALVPYHNIMEIFSLNDFDWTVTPSNRDTKEFKLVHGRIKAILTGEYACIFSFAKEEKELKEFIKNNFVAGKDDTAKVQINKNNFKWVYDRWAAEVMPSINVIWPAVKKLGILDGDFYLADLLSTDNKTISEKLSVLLKSDRYRYNKQTDEAGILFREADFVDGQRAHKRFWAKYERPPKEEYWNYIIDRRDLLVPQDIRERTGSFYTPKIWVELSQKYLADVFGEDWQDGYYIWDCAAGTGNLLAGLTNPRNVWASDLFDSNVAAMKTMGGLFENHVFQFDFLNDDFKKLPAGLREIINDEKKRKKLIIYINPPYAEHGSTAKKGHKISVATEHKVKKQYEEKLGAASRELFALFLIRVYNEIQRCKIANFAKLKALSASNFAVFRQNFPAKTEKMFVVPANTFDNVDGRFPIGFHILDTGKKEKAEEITADVFDENGRVIGQKTFYNYDGLLKITKWIKKHQTVSNKSADLIGYLNGGRNDFQNQNLVFIVHHRQPVQDTAGYYCVYKQNILQTAIYFAVRHCIPADWLNDRDQFLYPNDGWKKDKAFQNNCLAYTLFHGQNNISSKHGVNHWLPFVEYEVGAKSGFDSNFMTDFITGKDEIYNMTAEPSAQYGSSEAYCVLTEPLPLYGSFLDMGGSGGGDSKPPKPLKFSREAAAVFSAGRELWKYYHRQPRANVNASLYDIREHFQGRNENGKMNNKSTTIP